MFEITHHISIADANAHLLAVETTVRLAGQDGVLPSPLTFFMPVWTPGSYLVREYARHIEGLRVTGDAETVKVRKIRKNAWRVEPAGARAVLVQYRLYANDVSVRTNHVDRTHAYWNGAATYLGLEQAASVGARVVVNMPPDWEVATSLAEDSSAPLPHRTFLAKTFDELCDAPFECGKLIERSFVTLGKPHRIAAWKNADAHAIDWDKIKTDTQTIVETEASLLAGNGKGERALPYERYLFLWHITPRGRGGLEHRDSTTLMAKPSSFHTRNGYLDVLSLISHEFFHLWNVKRIRPEGLFPYRYQEENYTRLLWWFEGATSYYDWRILRLAKLCTPAEYLNHLAEEIARLLDTPGAEVHSLEESSFDAWTKAYRPDENSLNSTVSYYLKGEVVSALLDIELRHRTKGRVCLDDVVRYLYGTYGTKEIPLPEGELLAIVNELAGVPLDDSFARWVKGTEPLPIAEVFGQAGLAFERSPRRDGPRASLGVRLKLEGGRTLVEAVPRGGAGHKAGIDVGDEIIAVAGRRLPEGRAEPPVWGLTPGSPVPVVLARDGWIQTVDVVLDAPPLPEAKLIAVPEASGAARELYEAWMGDSFATAPTKPSARS